MMAVETPRPPQCVQRIRCGSQTLWACYRWRDTVWPQRALSVYLEVFSSPVQWRHDAIEGPPELQPMTVTRKEFERWKGMATATRLRQLPPGTRLLVDVVRKGGGMDTRSWKRTAVRYEAQLMGTDYPCTSGDSVEAAVEAMRQKVRHLNPGVTVELMEAETEVDGGR